jgi:GMP synthase (glutamine-hydrolysing)
METETQIRKRIGYIREFNAKEFVERSVKEIKEIIGNEKTIAACSGGVDSTVAAMLGKIAIGNNLKVVHINDNFRRIRESEKVVEELKKLGFNVILVDARKEFMNTLKKVSDAEEKRKIFRKVFYETLARVAKEENAKFLIQGTIAADVKETAGGIKTQHNVLEQIGIQPRDLYGFKIVEPLKDLFKPEVRKVARHLNLPEDISERMPFPGPGLLIRVVGEVTEEKLEILRKATQIIEEEFSSEDVFQAFGVILPGKATGIVNGKREYGYIIAIRVVKSEDAMTATVPEIPFEKLKKASQRITNEIPKVTRVVFDITDKPPATIEYE